MSGPPPPRAWPWILVPVVAVAALAIAAIVGLAASGTAAPWPWWGFFPWFPFVGIGIFFGFLVLFGPFRWSAGPWGWGYEPQRSRDLSGMILRERYARGEITRSQFAGMRRDLDEHLTHNAYEDDSAGRTNP